MSKGATAHKEGNPGCCGVIEQVRHEAEVKRSNRIGPQPWVVRKLTVGITLAIIIYASYVYIARFCVPMLLRQPMALGGEAMGIAFLVVFGILLIMMLWAYAMVVLIHPGQAKDYTPRCPQPTFPAPERPRGSNDSQDIAGASYENMHGTGDPPRSSTTHTRVPSNADSKALPPRQSIGKATTRSHSIRSRQARSSSDTRNQPRPADRNDSNAGVLDALPIPPAPSVPPPIDGKGNQDISDGTSPCYSRKPSSTPILLPPYRYCRRDEIVKPFRAHHCRACGTCILKYDHHCPWIGQCVGARNHKFFVHFLQWASLFCAWTMATLLGRNVKASSQPNFDLDIQKVVIIALAGLFFLFTASLLASHVRLLLMNQSTVESLGYRAMKERESATLGKMYSWYQFGEKKRTRRRWDSEWGKIGREGNIWWLGSKRENWESVMGSSPWWWILPIGRSPSDGLDYPVNPRFDAAGRWLPRKQWPLDLQ